MESGRALLMRVSELCTASCMLNNGEHLLMARTDRLQATDPQGTDLQATGKGTHQGTDPQGTVEGSTTLVVWDVLGNEPVRRLQHDVSMADHVSFLTVSADDRFVTPPYRVDYYPHPR